MAEPLRKPPALTDFDEDPFRYGYRPRFRRIPGGETEVEYLPLTAAELLDPQLGDCMVQSTWHLQFVDMFKEMLAGRYRSHSEVAVFSDLKMLWGIPGLAEPAPDVAVVFGIHDKGADRSVFDVQREGVLPRLVVEVLSGGVDVRNNDLVRKVSLYEQVGIAEYLLCDPRSAGSGRRATLSGYRLDAQGRYRKIVPDPRGRLLSETTGLFWSIRPDGLTPLLEDVVTGEPLLTFFEEAEARRHAEDQARREEEARLRAESELERLREEIARLRSSDG